MVMAVTVLSGSMVVISWWKCREQNALYVLFLLAFSPALGPNLPTEDGLSLHLPVWGAAIAQGASQAAPVA